MSIHKRTTNKGQVYDVFYREPDGKQRVKTFRKKKEALRFDVYVRDKKNRDEFPDVFREKVKMRFSALSEKWLELHSKPNKAPKSYIKDLGVIKNYLNPHFGDKDVNQIKTEDIQKYLTSRLYSSCLKTKRQVKPATVNRELEIVRKIFNDGMKWGYVRNNPCKGVKKLKEPERRIEYLAEEEVKHLLEQCSPEDKPLFAMAVYTGMRFGEIANLESSDVDFDKMVITVRIGSDTRETTKSGKIRHIPIATSLLPYLEDQKQRANGLFFPSKIVEGKKRTEVTKAFEGALRKAGINRHIRFHDLRHTFASHFVMKDGDLLALKAILGHSDLQMVQRYAHLAPDHLRKGIERLSF